MPAFHSTDFTGPAQPPPHPYLCRACHTVYLQASVVPVDSAHPCSVHLMQLVSKRRGYTDWKLEKGSH